MENEINYDKLVEKALKQVVIEALKIAADEGLPGENHFYISFKTNHSGVRMDTGGSTPNASAERKITFLAAGAEEIGRTMFWI